MRARTGTPSRRTHPARGLGFLAGAVAAVLVAGCTAESPDPPPRQVSDSGGVLTVDPSMRLDERVTLAQLPMPPTAPSAAPGSCTAEVNPRGTGCVGPGWGALGAAGTYWPDSNHVLIGADFAGAPVAGPGAGYDGPQLMLVKTDGTAFPSGDAWKCLTCGVAAPEQGDPESHFDNASLTYPINGFRDGKRALAGTTIVDCGEYVFADPRCTPERIRIRPIEWDPGLGVHGAFRELRLNPDDIHIGFSYMVAHQDKYEQIPFMGELVSDEAGGRYTVKNVRALHNPDPKYQPYLVAGGELTFNPAGMIGEFRGWNHDGTAALGIQSHTSGGVDAWATDNVTGR